MEHLIAKAQTIEAEEELGVFEALVSAWAEDRMGDVITPDAYDGTIAAWKASGKWLPLLFEHTTKAIGEIDPESLAVDEEGLRVRGHIDQSTDEGEQAWRQIKASTASFSIGFASESRPRKRGKGREIYEIDLLEISFTSTPVNAAARVLGWKSMADPDLNSMDLNELRTYSMSLVERTDLKSHRPIQIRTFGC